MKSFVTLFYYMTTSPLPSSVWYLQWKVQLSPRVFYSVLSAASWPFACILCTVLEQGTVYAIFSTQMWPENYVSRVSGEVEHQESLFVMLYLMTSEFQCFKLDTAWFCMYCSSDKYCFVTYLDEGWEQVSRVLGGIFHSFNHMWNYTPVQFRF